MNIDYGAVMTKLGVGYHLGLYESQPWLMYDEVRKLTCEAEVRCNYDQSEVEASIHLIPDTPIASKPPMEQICHLVIARHNESYTTKTFFFRNKSFHDSDLYDWQSNSYDFFHACVQEIRANKLPDFDALFEKIMKDTSRYNRSGGEGEGKNPKLNASKLLYDRKNGRGF